MKCQRPGDERNLLVTQCGQMLNRLPDPRWIVDPDITDPGQSGADVDEYQGYLPESQSLQQEILHAKGKHRDTFDTALDHAADGGFPCAWVVHSGGEEYFVSCCTAISSKD
jgi:hypothetical protein